MSTKIMRWAEIPFFVPAGTYAAMRQRAKWPPRGIAMMLALVIPPAAARAGAGPTTLPALRFQDLPVASVTLDLGRDEGPLELWRPGIGLGGVNSRPLPGRVVEGLARL